MNNTELRDRLLAARCQACTHPASMHATTGGDHFGCVDSGSECSCPQTWADALLPTIRDFRDAIVTEMRHLGWASLDEVAWLILAAGGEITVPDHLVVASDRLEVTVIDDPAAHGRKFRVSEVGR